jgi:hypothetical protein
MKSYYSSKTIKFGGTLLVLMTAFFASSGTTVAQQETPKSTTEVQQLKERLQQLEQTVDQLKAQLQSLESPPPKTDAPAGEPIAASAATTATTSPAPKPATADSNGESTFTVYGFAMLDAGYQFKQNHPDWFDTVRPTKLPSFANEFAPNGHTYFGVRQSRFGVKGTTPTRYGELKTIFEFELFGTGVDAGQTTFRLRHAYGELGKFGAGQYWSVFVDPDSFPNTIEYWGPNGLAWFRNVQFRWMPLQGNNAITIGLERPGASADQGRFADRIELQGIRSKFDLPDLTANARFTRDWGHVQIGALLRRIKWVDTIDDQFDLGGSATGWGVALSGAPKFGKNNTGRFQILYGAGVENYLNDAPVDIGIKITNSTNPRTPIKGIALPALGLSTYLDHTWNKKFTSSIGYSLVHIENSDGQAINAFHRGHYASGNVLYTPIENVMVGSEFLWGRRQNWHDGFHSDDFRIQFAFKYNFARTFKL